MTHNEMQIGDEVAKAQRDIQARLNHLELVTGLPVIYMELQSLNTTTMGDAAARFVRHVRIEVAMPPGTIGKA